MDWTLIFAVGVLALCVGYIVGGAIWTERPLPKQPIRSPWIRHTYGEGWTKYEAWNPSDSLDVPLPQTDVEYLPPTDVPLTITRVARPLGILTSDNPLVYLFERKDGSQLLVHVYADGEADLAERPDNSAVWGPPLTGTSR
jgi:hypothetical protein